MPYSPTDLIVNADGSIYHLGIRPEHLADKIITVGDPNRVKQVSKHFDTVEVEVNKREFITHTGTFKGKRITAISSGMGTDNVEILMTELDALVNIDLTKREPKDTFSKFTIVRVGTSGTVQPDVPVDSLMLSAYGLGLDSLMHFYAFEMTEKEQQIAVDLQRLLSLPYLPYCVAASTALRGKFAEMASGVTLTCHGFYAPQGRQIRTPIAYPNLTQQLSGFGSQGERITNIEMETAGYYALGRLLGHDMLSTNAILANRLTGTFSKNAEKTIDELIVRVLEGI